MEIDDDDDSDGGDDGNDDDGNDDKSVLQIFVKCKVYTYFSEKSHSQVTWQAVRFLFN